MTESWEQGREDGREAGEEESTFKGVYPQPGYSLQQVDCLFPLGVLREAIKVFAPLIEAYELGMERRNRNRINPLPPMSHCQSQLPCMAALQPNREPQSGGGRCMPPGARRNWDAWLTEAAA